MAGERSHHRPPGFLRALLTEQARILRIEPQPPPALRLRVLRWWTSTVLRESAPQLIAIGAIALAALRVLRFPARVSGALRALIATGVLWEVRNGILAHRSVARIDAALEDLEPPKSPTSRAVPRSHLAIPPLMFVTRDVKRERGLPFAEVDGHPPAPRHLPQRPPTIPAMSRGRR